MTLGRSGDEGLIGKTGTSWCRSRRRANRSHRRLRLPSRRLGLGGLRRRCRWMGSHRRRMVCSHRRRMWCLERRRCCHSQSGSRSRRQRTSAWQQGRSKGSSACSIQFHPPPRGSWRLLTQGRHRLRRCPLTSKIRISVGQAADTRQLSGGPTLHRGAEGFEKLNLLAVRKHHRPLTVFPR